MNYVTGEAWKELVAQAVMGDAVDLLPTHLVIGDGAWTGSAVRAPRSSGLYNQTGSFALDNVQRNGGSIVITHFLPGQSTPFTLNEVGVKTASGVIVLHGTFAPESIGANVGVNFSFVLFPMATEEV